MAFTWPACWSDDERMNFLFQPFRVRQLNPISYDAKMSFWADLIPTYILHECQTSSDPLSLTLTLDIKELSLLFMRNGQMPRCLQDVLPKIPPDVLAEETEFKNNLRDVVSKQTASWASWGYQVLVSSPIKRVTDKVVTAVSPRHDSPARLVLVPRLKSAAEHLHKLIRRRSEEHVGIPAQCLSVISHDELLAMTKNSNPPELDLVLLWLQSQRLVHKSVQPDNTVLYKFSLDVNTNASPPTYVEIGVWKLQSSKQQIETALDRLQIKINDLNESIRKQIKLKNRSAALRLLKRRKLMEKKLDLYTVHHDRLDVILDEIFTSESTQHVLKAYELGTNTIKNMNKETRVDDIAELMDNMAEAVDDSKEASAALAASLDDNTELEEELEELLREDGAPPPGDGSGNVNVDIADTLQELNLKDLPSPGTSLPSSVDARVVIPE